MPLLGLEAPFWMSGAWVSATFVATPVEVLAAGGSYASWNISCADADQFMVIPHGFKQVSPSGNPATGVTPDAVLIIPNTSARALAGAYAVSVDQTNITLTKTGSGGSGGTPAAKLIAIRPKSNIE